MNAVVLFVIRDLVQVKAFASLMVQTALVVGIAAALIAIVVHAQVKAFVSLMVQTAQAVGTAAVSVATGAHAPAKAFVSQLDPVAPIAQTVAALTVMTGLVLSKRIVVLSMGSLSLLQGPPFSKKGLSWG